MNTIKGLVLIALVAALTANGNTVIERASGTNLVLDARVNGISATSMSVKDSAAKEILAAEDLSVNSVRAEFNDFGETEIHMTANLFFGRWAKQAVEVEQIRRCADPIFLDKKFDVWVSVRGEGPKLFPGDVRKDRLFIDQLFLIPVEKSL